MRAALSTHAPSQAPVEPRAAVAAVLRVGPSGALEVLVIQRAERPGDPWSGHMAFPGGRRERGDRDIAETAVRETDEELGLSLPVHGEPLGPLDDIPTHTGGLVVRPFVWALFSVPELSPSADEVAHTFWVPLEELRQGLADTTYRFRWKGLEHDMPGYAVADRVIWGLTYRMLRVLFDAVG